MANEFSGRGGSKLRNFFLILFGTQKRQLATFFALGAAIFAGLAFSGVTQRFFAPDQSRAMMTDIPKRQLRQTESTMGAVQRANLPVVGGARMLREALKDRVSGLPLAGFQKSKGPPSPAVSFLRRKGTTVILPADGRARASGGTADRVLRQTAYEMPEVKEAGRKGPVTKVPVSPNMQQTFMYQRAVLRNSKLRLDNLRQLTKSYAATSAAPKKGAGAITTARSSGFDGEKTPDVKMNYTVPVLMTENQLAASGSGQYFADRGDGGELGKTCDAASVKHNAVISGIDTEISIIAEMLGREPSCCGESLLSWNAGIARLNKLCAERNEHAQEVARACLSGGLSVSCSAYSMLSKKPESRMLCGMKFSAGALAIAVGAALLALSLSGLSAPFFSLAGAALLGAGIFLSGGTVALVRQPQLIVEPAYIEALKSIAEESLRTALLPAPAASSDILSGFASSPQPERGYTADPEP